MNIEYKAIHDFGCDELEQIFLSVEVARLVDENGSAVILKNNVPRYLIVEFSQAENEQIAVDEDVMDISKRLIAKNKKAYEVLAK